MHQGMCGRSITIQGSVPASPETPMTEGEFSLPLDTPIANSIEANLVQFGYAPRELSAPPVESLDQGEFHVPLEP